MSQSRRFIALEKSESPYFVGVDLGGTNVKVGVVDNRGESLSWLTIPTQVEDGPETATQRMGQAVKDAIGEAGLAADDIARVGLGSPGTMDIPAGKLVQPGNLPGWDDFPIRDRLAEHCGLPVSFANDAAAAAFGEWWIGSGRDFHSLVMLTLGTGIGCGIIIGDKSLDGENSHGAECGHIIIDYAEDARRCTCGQPGHLEAYASAVGVINRTQDLLDDGSTTSIRNRLSKGERLTPKLVAEEAEAGDELALHVVQQTAMFLGVGIVSLMHTIDPSGVLLGGAMNFGGAGHRLGEQFLDWVRDEVRRRAFAVLAERTAIEFASLGGDAGYIGAAGIARADHTRGAERSMA
jgi:glucokinase